MGALTFTDRAKTRRGGAFSDEPAAANVLRWLGGAGSVELLGMKDKNLDLAELEKIEQLIKQAKENIKTS